MTITRSSYEFPKWRKMPTRKFIQNHPVSQRVLVDYCQLLLCESDKSTLRCDSVFNRDSDSRSGGSALALVVITIKDTVTSQRLKIYHSRTRGATANNHLYPL